MASGPEPAGAVAAEEDEVAGAAVVAAGAADVAAGAAEVVAAVLAGAVDVLVEDELLLRATTIIASNTTAAITAITTREDERCVFVLPDLLEEDFGGVAAAVVRGSGVEETDVRLPESGTSGITIRAAERLATFFEERFAVFLDADFFAVFFTARLAVFLGADFFAVFFTARLAEVFLAADFFAVFLAVFFTATFVSPCWFDIKISWHLHTNYCANSTPDEASGKKGSAKITRAVQANLA